VTRRVAALAVALSLAAATGASAEAPLAASAVARSAGRAQLLVALRPGARIAAARLVSSALNVYEVSAPPGSDPRAAARRLLSRPGVIAAQPDWILHEAQTFALCRDRPQNPMGYLVPAVGADIVQQPATTGTIAVLDSGIDSTIPEFFGRIVNPVNVLSGGNDVTDTDGHGTEVSGVAAARPGGIAGVSQNSPIMPVKMLDPQGDTSVATFVKAMDAAVAAHASVINVSSAAPATDTSPSEDRVATMAIDRAFASGAIVVAAAGNEGSSTPDVPSAYPHVLSVAATDDADQPASFSNSGGSIDLAAPGVNVLSLVPQALCPSQVASVEGTSFSSPAVAGAAAIVRADRATLTPSQVFELLRRSARDVGPKGWDAQTGFGVVNVVQALNAKPPADEPGELDDDVYWVRGRYASGHPFQLSAHRRSRTIKDRLGAFNDPFDVFRLKLKKGDKLTATLKGAPGTRFALGLWNPRTGAFDISDRRTRHLSDYADHRGSKESLRDRISKSGVWYLDLEAPHADPSSGNTSYTLRLKRG
jgi:subtilisin family serine protease